MGVPTPPCVGSTSNEGMWNPVTRVWRGYSNRHALESDQAHYTAFLMSIPLLQAIVWSHCCAYCIAQWCCVVCAALWPLVIYSLLRPLIWGHGKHMSRECCLIYLGAIDFC